MNVGLDGSRLDVKKKTGVEYIGEKIISGLLRYDRTNNYVIFLRGDISQQTSQNLQKIRKGSLEYIRIPHRFFWTKFWLPFYLYKHKIDIFFSPFYTIPLFFFRKKISLVHGLEYLEFPDAYSLKDRLILRLNTWINARFSLKIIVMSKKTERLLIAKYPFVQDKIVRISPPFLNKKVVSKQYSVFNTRKENLILYVGRIEKRKNLDVLLDAFKMLCDQLNDLPKLILAGNIGYGGEEIVEKIKRLQKENYPIAYRGYISDFEKTSLFEQAKILYYNSLTEGVGLPIIEAQNKGVFILTNKNISSNIIGENYPLVSDVLNVDEVYSLIRKVLSDQDFYNKIREIGFENVKKFGIEENVEKIIKGCFC